jgi:hypothetical protein
MHDPDVASLDGPINEVRVSPDGEDPHAAFSRKPATFRKVAYHAYGGVQCSLDVASSLQILTAQILNDRLKIAARAA